MDNLEKEHGTIKPAQSDELDLDEIVNEFKDYSPEQEQAAQADFSSSIHASAAPVKAAAGAGKKILIGALCALGLGVVGLGAYFGISALKGRQPEPVATEAPTEAPAATTTEMAVITTEAPKETTTEAAPETTEAGTTEFKPSEALAAAVADNPDIIGMLTYGREDPLFVPQCEDNNYYLTRDYQKKSSWNGAPFLDYRNSLEPRDTNLMIHGHNMKDGKIFANLKYFYQRDYIRNFPIITFETPEGIEYYVIYAITDVEVDPNTSTYFKITKWNFDTDQEFEDYTGYMIKNSRFELPVTVEPDDELLTLSTCNYIGVDGRLLICCRKLHEDETVEAIQELFQEALYTDNAA